MFAQRPPTRQGFTLLEILLVVAAIAILAGIVIVAINPGRQLGETRNAQRKVDVRTILSAIQQYNLKEGALPEAINTGSTCAEEENEICKTNASPCQTDLSELTDNQTYLTSIPVDPSAGSTGTGYYVHKSATTGRVTVCAPSAELSETISVTQ